MKQILLILFLSVLLAATSFAATNWANSCKTKCQKTTTAKNTVVTKKSVLELARRAAQVSSSQKNIFPEFIIGNTFYKL